ncbi:hypothetical protein LCGC14_0660330 [marine sediment metagenome]|uniref:Uncharacterized protein n=1 Tax=marine sediment metagenome TaxID=412755 RepID=A0A0F9QTS2_9ZZZZ
MVKQLRGIISILQELNDNWNDDYWIFVGAGELCLMKLNEDGKQAMTYGKGVDQDYVVASFPMIDADGGGW